MSPSNDDSSPMVRLAERRSREGFLLWDTELVGGIPDGTLFDPESWRADGALANQAQGRGTAYFLRAPTGGHWVLRHYRRGGMVARVNRDRYLWTGARRSRPGREARILAGLYNRGLAVPRPVAALARRVGGISYTADLITVAIEDSLPLADHLQSVCLPESGWKRLGATIARLHRAGVWHADLNARNVLLTAGEFFHLIDFDRARHREDGAWRQANLARLKRSLDKFAAQARVFHFTVRDWAALNEGYEAEFATGGR